MWYGNLTYFVLELNLRYAIFVHWKGHLLYRKGVTYVDIASEPAHSSLAQRIATVRNYMLVELSIGVSPTDKDLFASVCQTYEQNSVMTSRTISASSQNALDQVFSLSHLTPESILLYGFTPISDRNTPPRQHRVGFSIVRWPSLTGEEDDDWDDTK